MKMTAAIITVSDKGSRGERQDASGPLLCDLCRQNGYEVVYTSIIPDEKDTISRELIKCADSLAATLILTTGGTGFSPRDVTPEATLSVLERETRGIPELMRAESMKITPRACLSRAVAGIRGRSLIINLPGSPKGAKENLQAVIGSIEHGVEMLLSAGSADCAAPVKETTGAVKRERPSIDAWMKQAKQAPDADKVGMYLTHVGIVRSTAKARVRKGDCDAAPVVGMYFSYDEKGVEEAVTAARAMEGIHYVRVWLNQGELTVGDDIMQVLIGGDIRPHVIDALQTLVGRIKNECVQETERYDQQKK